MSRGPRVAAPPGPPLALSCLALPCLGLLALALLGPLAPAARAEAAAPPGCAWAGDWEGEVVQSDPPARYLAQVTLTCDGGRLATGRLDLPALACGGRLLPVGTQADTLILAVQLSYGHDTCIDGGQVVLTPAAGGGLEYRWRAAAGAAPLVQGPLARWDKH